MLKLDLENMPLNGRHLIEASAGTGKTYSITRLYLRLLLEKQIPVERILLMTYTRAATEELRGRIKETLMHAKDNWSSDPDPFLQSLYLQVDAKQAKLRLHQALLNLDQAAIFTIHGFCARALQQHAFTSQTGLEVVLEANTYDLVYQALQDWLRVAILQPTLYQQLTKHGWHTPEGFWSSFGSALRSQTPVFACDAQIWHQAWYDNKADVRQRLLELEAQMIDATMSDPKTQHERRMQWQDLLNWLALPEFGPAAKEHLACLNGNRLNKAPTLKPLVKALLDRINNKSFNEGYLVYAQQNQVSADILEAINSIRANYQMAKHKQQVMEFDDLVSGLSHSLTQTGSKALVEALREAYPVALVDEFQDTDAHQYAILNSLYEKGSQTNALFMIGDPKQAIYGFRGGDIHTYLQASNATDYRWYMDTNWRSSQAMIASYNQLFTLANQHQRLGPSINYTQVKASPGATANQAHNPKATGAALSYVWLPTTATSNEYKYQYIADWCANEVATLLQAGQFEAHDIALLVRGASEAQALQKALTKWQLASVYISDRSSVYASNEALELLRLLNGILHCEDHRQLVRAVSTNLWGGNLSVIEAMRVDDEKLIRVRSHMMQMRNLWFRQGAMALVMTLIKQQAVPPTQNKARYLTNMVQLAELLQKASTQASSALLLVEWLQKQCDSNDYDTDASAELRLDSDAKLIQIVTQHGSKGLEYPVVFVPFASQYKDPLKKGNKKAQLFAYHHPQEQCQALMVGRHPQVCEQMIKASEEESLRLLYVAITRAQYRCYVGVSNFSNGHKSPLGQVVCHGQNSTDEFDWLKSLKALSNGKDSELICVDEDEQLAKPPLTMRKLNAPSSEQSSLKYQAFTGHIDSNRHLLSYSALVRQLSYGAHASVTSPKDRGDGTSKLIEKSVEQSATQLRFTLAKGKNSGLLLHDILEQVDFSNPNWSTAMELPLAKYQTLVGMGEDDENTRTGLSQWLSEVLLAPLPSIVSERSHTRVCLAELSLQQVLKESEFYFPLHEAKQAKLAQILSEHRGGSATALPTHPVLNGMMHGFIDLVFEHGGRFYVADYKSNHLGYTLGDYTQQAMLEANQSHYYDLQYLIYSLALHRYLGQRLANYDAEKHFGGVYYLYLRGMAEHSDTGVFASQVSLAELNKLDDLFGGVI